MNFNNVSLGKQTKMALIIIGLSLTFGLILWMIRRRVDREEARSPSNENIPSRQRASRRNSFRSKLSCNKVLKKGVYDSDEVAVLQSDINKYFGLYVQPILVVDGDFGDLTKDALELVTKLNGQRAVSSITLTEWYRRTGIQPEANLCKP